MWDTYTKDATRMLHLSCRLISNLSWQASVLFNYFFEMIERARDRERINKKKKKKKADKRDEDKKKKLHPRSK